MPAVQERARIYTRLNSYDYQFQSGQVQAVRWPKALSERLPASQSRSTGLADRTRLYLIKFVAAIASLHVDCCVCVFNRSTQFLTAGRRRVSHPICLPEEN